LEKAFKWPFKRPSTDLEKTFEKPLRSLLKAIYKPV